jgi:hypothetical protein
MQTRKLFAILLVVTTATPMRGAQRDWKTATLIETSRLDPVVRHNADGSEVRSMTTNQAYTFDLGDRTVVCSDPSFSWIRLKAVNVAVGAKISYLRADNLTLLFLDSKGKEHKCLIQHEVLKPTPAP